METSEDTLHYCVIEIFGRMLDGSLLDLFPTLMASPPPSTPDTYVESTSSGPPSASIEPLDLYPRCVIEASLDHSITSTKARVEMAHENPIK
jgi:hypothetical protein